MLRKFIYDHGCDIETGVGMVIACIIVGIIEFSPLHTMGIIHLISILLALNITYASIRITQNIIDKYNDKTRKLLDKDNNKE